MIVLAVLIAFDCFDLVAEIMIEQEIRGENLIKIIILCTVLTRNIGFYLSTFVYA